MNIDNLTITSLDCMTMWSPKNELLFVLEELQNVSIQNEEETTDITGKNGRKIATLQKNKTVTISGANGLISDGLLAVQTGGDHDVDVEQDISCFENVQLKDPLSATIKYDAVGAVGREIRAACLETPGGILDTNHQLKQGATAVKNKTFAYDPATRTLTFAEGQFEKGDVVRVFYDRKMIVTRVNNPSDKYACGGSATIDFQAKDTCQNVYHGQFRIPRAQFHGSFTLDFGNDQSVHNFELEALAAVNACDKSSFGSAANMWEYVIFMDEENDEETPENPDDPGTGGTDDPGTGGGDTPGGGGTDTPDTPGGDGGDTPVEDTQVTVAMDADSVLTWEVGDTANLPVLKVSHDETTATLTYTWKDPNGLIMAPVLGETLADTLNVSADLLGTSADTKTFTCEVSAANTKGENVPVTGSPVSFAVTVTEP